MKISKKPTDWILITVSNDNPLDAADFVLMQLSTEYVNQLRFQLQGAQMMAATPRFYCLSCWDAPTGWYVHNGEGIKGHLEIQQLTWCFIEWDSPREFKDLLQIQEHMDAEQLCFFETGTAQFVGTGKHSGEEYYSSEFPLADILQRYDDR
jgi:hypothetical protein